MNSGPQDSIDEEKDDNWRVKVYYLDGEGLWTDIGTGFTTCREVQRINIYDMIYYIYIYIYISYSTMFYIFVFIKYNFI